jgi:ABC-type phosphate transport system substrate-binding protein
MKVFLLVILPFISLNFSADPLELNESVAVIVHESVAVSSFSKNDLIEIYTLRRSSWSDGSRITITDYKGESQIRDEFYSYIDIRVSAIKRLWLKEQFTGRSLPPKVVRSVDEMTKLVVGNPGTIGYVPVSDIPEESKVLMIIER